MSKMLQVRNVPDEVHAALVERARAAGMSLSEYVGRELRRLAATPTWDELEVRARARGSRLSLPDSAAVIRAERDARDAELAPRVSSGP